MNPDVQYLMDCLGGGVLFFFGWWAFCIMVRNAIDGTVFLFDVFRYKKKLPRLINGWRPGVKK